MSIEKFSLNQIEELANGDKQFIKEMIVIFLGQIEGFILNMKTFFSDGDMKNLAKEAHTAKSSALIFGMEQTSVYLKKIQSLAEEETTDSIPELMKLSEIDLLDTSDKLSKILNNYS